MKKTVLLLSVLLAMTAWYPLLVIKGWVSGFSVTFRYPLLSFLVSTVAFSGISLHLLTDKEKNVNTASAVLSGLLPYASAVNLFVWMVENPGFPTYALSLLWSALALALFVAYGRQSILRGCIMGTSLLILVPLVLISMLFACFSRFPIGKNTVVQTLSSPAGTYYAELIDSDQGALGGDTVVNVYTAKAEVDMFFLEVRKDPQMVYLGEWGEFENMKLEWESEQVLLINGNPYAIN